MIPTYMKVYAAYVFALFFMAMLFITTTATPAHNASAGVGNQMSLRGQERADRGSERTWLDEMRCHIRGTGIVCDRTQLQEKRQERRVSNAAR